MKNVPDDWGMYYFTCVLCGQKYHASDGGCIDCYERRQEEEERERREDEEREAENEKDRSLEGFLRETFSDEFIKESEIEYKKAQADGRLWEAEDNETN